MESKPYVKEFSNEQEVAKAVITLQSNGVNPENIFVLTHDQDRTNRIAKKAGANTIGVNEQDLGSLLVNVFGSTGDRLRTMMEDIGISLDEASLYEEKLDQGKILLFVKD